VINEIGFAKHYLRAGGTFGLSVKENLTNLSSA